jgi:tetratricopeptide (TPR) repeat protein
MVQQVIAIHGEHQFYSYNAIEFLAKVYWDEGLQDEAIEILQKSLESRQSSLGQEQLNAFSIEQLAGWYLEKGDFRNAALYLSRATKILSLHFGEGDVRTQSMRTVLADTIQKQNTARYL